MTGEDWKQNRKVLDKKFMVMSQVHKYNSGVDESALMVVNLMEDLLTTEKKPIDIEDILRCYVCEAMGTILFGYHLNFIQKEMPPRLKDFLKNLHEVATSTTSLTLFPLYRYFSTPTWKSFNHYILAVEKQMVQFIRESDEINKDKERHDAMHFFISNGQNMDRAIKNASNMFSAGIESTRATILWAIYNLGRYPQLQERLRKEVLSHLRNKSSPLTPEVLKELKYIRDVVKESLRLTPTGIGVIRKLMEPGSIQGYDIPKDVSVILMQRYAVIKEKNFENPMEFKPERWSDHSKSHSPWVHLPFGFGPRMCQGVRLADLTIYAILARLVQNYRWTTNSDVKSDMELFVFPDRPLPLTWEIIDHQ